MDLSIAPDLAPVLAPQVLHHQKTLAWTDPGADDRHCLSSTGQAGSTQPEGKGLLPRLSQQVVQCVQLAAGGYLVCEAAGLRFKSQI